MNMIAQQLGVADVIVIYTIFGCWRFRLTLHPDGTITRNSEEPSGFEQFWRLDGGRLVFYGLQIGDCAEFHVGEHPTEMRGRWLQGDSPRVKIALDVCHQPVAVANASICIVIGSHENPDWAISNARACLHLNPGVKVLVADDSSSEQTQAVLAEASRKYGFSLSISETPLGHWPGDALSLRKTIAFADECNSAVAIRCNQRTIQLKPNWASQIAGTMLSDDSAVAYQCIWGKPHEIRTEFLAFAVDRWRRAKHLLVCGDMPLGHRTGWLFEQWFHDLSWTLFPWAHSPVDWFSRNRWAETQWTLSYYGGCSAVQAAAFVDAMINNPSTT